MNNGLKLDVNLNGYLPLRDVVFNTLREAIIKGDLKPGERLMENQLAETLGVSRTPIREAIRKLELEKFVIMIPRKGAEVASYTKKDITDVLEVRAALEALAVTIACEKMQGQDMKKLVELKEEFAKAAKNKNIEEIISKDVEFHDIILKSTNNEKLIQILNNLSEQIYRFRVRYINKMMDYSSLVKEHDEIVESVLKRDVIAAEKITYEHIKRQKIAVVEMLANSIDSLN